MPSAGAMPVTAWRAFAVNDTTECRLTRMAVDDLSPGEVVIRVEWSSVNYKDALGLTARGRIFRALPVNAGIDAAGRVVSSSDARFAAGDAVLVNGMGLGESHDGGLATHLRVPAAWVVPLAEGMTARDAMAVGTAGFTAALALRRMETSGQEPGLGPVVVTGASGGVGSVAVPLLTARGYEVTAVSDRPAHHEYLRALGAAAAITPGALGLGSRPLEQARYGGAIDNVGGALLAGLLRHVKPWGNVAAVGNAGGHAFDATVFPFILRGVSLLGVSSTNCPMDLRSRIWSGLAGAIDPEHLSRIVAREVPLERALDAAEALLAREVRGRILVDCRQAD